MAIDIHAAQQGEYQRQGGQTKDLEVDPDILRQPEGDINIRQSAKDEKHCPGQIQTRPHLLRQRQLFTQHALDQRLLHHPLAKQQRAGKQHVNNRHLPFNKLIVMEEDG